MKSFTSRISNIRRSFCSASLEEVLVTKYPSTIVMTLNKQKVLNSLDLDMIKSLRKHVASFNSQPNIKAVLLKGAGGKAFCAGGDVKTIYNNIKENQPQLAVEFFTTEYKCDYEIATMNPIQISILNGIVMGGGVGVSINAPIKIACESSMFAMPESKIGLFTDVGASFFLPRLKSKIGYYLGLTSRRLKGKDLVSAGVATHFVPNSSLESLEEALISKISPTSEKEEILKIVESFSQNVPLALQNEEAITHYFSGNSFEEIYTKIKNADDEFGKALFADLQSGSPLSLRVIYEMLERGKSMTLKECYQMDSHLASHFVTGSDFVEGVRALLIEKDNKPVWKFSDPLLIPEEEVSKFFEEKGEILF